MLSTKTLATLLLFTLNMQLAAPTTPSDHLGGQIYLMNLLRERRERASESEKILADTSSTLKPVEVQRENNKFSKGTQRPSPPAPMKERMRTSKTNQQMLQDETSIVTDVQPKEANMGKIVQAQEQPVPQVNKEFEALIKQEKYAEIFALGKNMKPDEFWEQLVPLVKTPEQWKGIADNVTVRMMPIFFLYGDIEIIKSTIHVDKPTGGYAPNSYLLAAFSLAFKQNLYDHFLKLLEAVTWMTTNEDESLKIEGRMTHVEYFLSRFFYDLAPEKDDMTLRRFLTFHGDDLKSKRPDSFDTIFQELVCHLRKKPNAPNTEKLLIDIIGQPSMLTSVSFTKGFLKTASDYPNFIKYGWREVIGENLEREYLKGVSNLWQAIRSKYPNEFSEEHPAPATEAFAIVLERFKTKQQKEEEWKERSLAPLSNKLKSLNILPEVLCPISIIAEYAVSLTITEDPTISGK